MPELPEVEVVRRGLSEHIAGRRIAAAKVFSPRTARRFEAGPEALAHSLEGRRVGAVSRRGKYLWLDLDGPAGSALVVHLGMSGQMLVKTGARRPGGPGVPHLRAYLDLGPDENPGEGPSSAAGAGAWSMGRVGSPSAEGACGGRLRVEFVDQRTFGWWLPAPMVRVDGALVPAPVAHIARDPMDPAFDPAAVAEAMRAKHTEVKRLLLDQTVVSGIGNIYADEALWRAGIHGARAADALSRPALRRLLAAAREVMTEALAQGGTSFDSLYVDVNGRSGYFSRGLAVYGREGRECRRCGRAVRRESFMNRSSYSCPRCQVRPRYPLR